MANEVESSALFGLGFEEQQALLEHMQGVGQGGKEKDGRKRSGTAIVPERFAQFSELPEYKKLGVHRIIAEKTGIMNPFFTCHETRAKNWTRINGQPFRNFATYDYLGLNGHPEINEAAHAAMLEFGTSAGASRLVAGERPQHAMLEKSIAAAYGQESALTFVSGHATNISTLSTLLGPRDAVYHDALAHNSLILGAVLSGAARYAYPHNDCDALETMLRETRAKHERVIIVTEGLFSMDGSIANLPALVQLKRDYTCFLMVDEAHSFGVLGEKGLGCTEHFGLSRNDVDIWMGTLSKTLCGCGGYIAGCTELIDLLKFRAPGFVYSVGMPPPIAAASAKALEIMLREPERTQRLQHISRIFLQEAKARGLNTGYATGNAIIPVIVGNSLVAGGLAAALFKRNINVMPIIYPVVEEGMARLRFFLSADHTQEDVIASLDVVMEELPHVNRTT